MVDDSGRVGSMPAGAESTGSDPFAIISRSRGRSPGQIKLPSPLTPLIGRERELGAAKQLLLEGDTRLLTFTGPGGSGKTRLGVELGWSLVDHFPGGVFLVSLGTLTDPALVVPSIAQTVGVPEKKDQTLLQSLRDSLKERSVLLILDNYEHLLTEVAVVNELLVDCPKLRIVVTSRTSLRIRGEQEFPVLPLPLPDLRQLPSVEVLLQYAAVLLFVERARAIRPDFAVTGHNARSVAEICVMLDGLPLALELAAARIRILSPSEMLKRMEKRLQLLSSGAREAPVRQRTLRDTIQWSHDLLDEDEKKVFRRLSVIVGSFSLEIAESVCTVGQEAPGDVLERLNKLVEKNVIQSREVNGEQRFAMLDTIREFALERLDASGESEETFERYATYLVSLLERADAELKGPNQDYWLKRLDPEYDGLRCALGWSIKNGKADLSLRLVSSLWRYWYPRGYWSEGRMWLTKALNAETGSKALRARALRSAGAFASVQGDFTIARSYLEESLKLAEEAGDKEGIALVLNSLGTDMISHNDFSGDRLLERSLVMMQGTGNKWGAATVLNNLGFSAQARGENDKAIMLYEQSLQLFRELGDKQHVVYLQINLAANWRDKREYDKARTLLNETLPLSRQLDEKVCIAESLLYLASVDSRQRHFERVNEFLSESLTLADELGNKELIATCLDEFAGLACAKNQPDRAARLFAASERLRALAKLEIPLGSKEKREQDLEITRSTLGEEKFGAESLRGREMSVEESIAYALSR